MALIISDANIFIDMETGGLIRYMFQLEEKFGVPNVLYEEELIAHHPELPEYGLRILDINPEYVEEAYRLGDVYNQPSENDLLALALAKQENSPLLTGDAKLRDAAENEQVEVFGTLWLIERMFANKAIDFQTAETAYRRMKEDGRRLPWEEVENQLERFRNR